jgi:hypothetical protein
MPMPERYGAWLLLERLAVGGMAEVFLAVRDGELPGRLFTLKRLLPMLAQDEEQVTLFLDEARLAAQLVHPALPAVRELARHGAGYHIAFDYVPGKDLRAVAERAHGLGGPLTPGLAAAVARWPGRWPTRSITSTAPGAPAAPRCTSSTATCRRGTCSSGTTGWSGSSTSASPRPISAAGRPARASRPPCAASSPT